MAKDNGTIEQAEPNKRGRKPKWTDEKVQKICEAIANGKSYKDAMLAGRVSHDTFYRHLRDDKDFSDKVKKAESQYQDWYDSQVVVDSKRSLLELIRGYEWDEVTTETIPAKGDKPAITKTKVVHKKAAPSATAIIFALCNRDPENWKNRINNELSGKLETDNKPGITLANVPDELLAQVIDAINGK